MTRRRARNAAAIAALGALALSSTGCPFLHGATQKPKVTLRGVDIAGVDFQAAHLVATLDVQNPLPVGIPVAKLNWAVKVEGNQLAAGAVDDATTVPAGGVAPVKLPFDLKFEDLYRIATQFKDQDTAPYHLDGTVAINTPIGPVDVPFAHDGTVPVLKVPQVEVSKVDVGKVDFGGATIKISFAVKNPNSMPLDVSALDYALTLAGQKIAEGALAAPLTIPAKGDGTFDAGVKLGFAQAAAAAQTLRSNASVDYSIGGTLSAKTPWGALSTPYNRAGTVKISR